MEPLCHLENQDALTPAEARAWLVEIGRRVYARGFVAANDGNLSLRLPDGTFLCTPTGVSKGFLRPDMICRVDAEGHTLEAVGPFRPSSEFPMHLRVYRDRPDAKAVVHAHPPTATAFACLNRPLVEKLMPEAVLFFGEVPVAPYGTPSTEEIPEAIAPLLQDHDALLLQNHGALAWGSDLQAAYFRLEGLEFYATILEKALRLGGGRVDEIAGERLERLITLIRTYHPGRNPLVRG